MEKLFVIKIGGNIIDDEQKLSSFLKSFAEIQEQKILVHGGGKLASQLAEKLNIPQQLVDGRRITDEETLKIVTMVYAGYINKNIVSQLQSNNCNAVGISGADGNVILAHKRDHPTIDYGFVGDIDKINIVLLKDLLEKNITVVIAPITHNGKGQLLNTNADTIAAETAKALSSSFDVTLIYCFEKNGVLLDVNDESTTINKLTWNEYQKLKENSNTSLGPSGRSGLTGEGGKIFAGMIPKLDNAFAALNNGVKKVLIGKAEKMKQLIAEKTGTAIVNE